MSNKISDISAIIATENNALRIYFKDGSSIETIRIDFYDDGTFDV